MTSLSASVSLACESGSSRASDLGDGVGVTLGVGSLAASGPGYLDGEQLNSTSLSPADSTLFFFGGGTLVPLSLAGFVITV